jgi:hypothetical protein
VLVTASVILTVITAFVLSDLLRSADSSPLVRESSRPHESPRFFAASVSTPVPAVPAPRVPIEVLVSEIERHVRLERAVAESFHLAPTSQALHVQGASPLLH